MLRDAQIDGVIKRSPFEDLPRKGWWPEIETPAPDPFDDKPAFRGVGSLPFYGDAPRLGFVLLGQRQTVETPRLESSVTGYPNLNCPVHGKSSHSSGLSSATPATSL
jgi:hypothetical protein